MSAMLSSSPRDRMAAQATIAAATAPPPQDPGAQIRRIATWAALAMPLGFVFCFFFVPMGWLFLTSLSDDVPGQGLRLSGTLQHYARYWLDGFYLTKSFWPTIWLSVTATVLTMVIGYVLAAYIASLPVERRGFLMMLVIVTLSISTVIRIFGLNVLLMNNGVINQALVALGLPRLRLMHSEIAVLIGLVQIAIPYAVVPLIGVLAGINPALKEAAESVGAGKLRTFLSVTLPLSMPGVIAGGVIVLSNNLSAMVIPSMMGGGRVRMIGILAYQQTTTQGNLPFAAAIGISLSAVTILVSALILWMLNASLKAGRT